MDMVFKLYLFHYLTKLEKAGGGWCWCQSPTGRNCRNWPDNTFIQFYLMRLLPCSLFLPGTSSKFSPRMRLLKVCVSEGWNGKRLRKVVSLHVLPASKQEGEERNKYFEPLISLWVKTYLIWNSFCLFLNLLFGLHCYIEMRKLIKWIW